MQAIYTVILFNKNGHKTLTFQDTYKELPDTMEHSGILFHKDITCKQIVCYSESN